MTGRGSGGSTGGMAPEPTEESPLVRQYLEAFGEVARLVASAADVPESVWVTIRVTWDQMSRDEREVIEQWTRRAR